VSLSPDHLKLVHRTGKVLASTCVVMIGSFRAPDLSIRNGLVSESISGIPGLFYVIQVTSS